MSKELFKRIQHCCATLRRCSCPFHKRSLPWLRHLGCARLGNPDLDVQNLNPDFPIENENGFDLREIRLQGGFQLRNQNPDFLRFPFVVRLGNPKKDLLNCSREQRTILCFWISRSIGKSGFRFWKSKSGFPNRTHLFSLFLKAFLLKRKKIATQGRTRTFRILISLPYHYIVPLRL